MITRPLKIFLELVSSELYFDYHERSQDFQKSRKCIFSGTPDITCPNYDNMGTSDGRNKKGFRLKELLSCEN